MIAAVFISLSIVIGVSMVCSSAEKIAKMVVEAKSKEQT